jgi:mannosylglycerate hydrolase
MVAPMQRFVTVRDAKKGFTLIAKGLPEYELKLDEPGILALTLLRCVGKLSGRDLITRPGGAAGWWNETPEAQCPGTHTFEYALFPHAGNESDVWSSIVSEVETFTTPPLVVSRKNEQAILEKSFFSLQPDWTCFLTALKIADNGDGIILRLNNPVDTPKSGVIHSESSLKSAFRARMNEEIIEPIEVERDHDISFKAKPFEVLTLLVKL